MRLDVSSEKAHGWTLFGYSAAGRCFPKEKATAFGLATLVLLAGLVTVMVSGCGSYKQDLEEANKRIGSLTSDNKKFSEIMAGLEKDKHRLTEERQSAVAKIDAPLKELGDWKKTNGNLSDEISKLKKNNSELSTDLNLLRREKTVLSQQIDESEKPLCGAGEAGSAAQCWTPRK